MPKSDKPARPDSEPDPRPAALDDWLALQTLVDSLARIAGRDAEPPRHPVDFRL